ncbi:MAG: DsbA family protein [Chloroflexi bacterium]|nr:DsbA family protein [Chloroflexota bacterium]
MRPVVLDALRQLGDKFRLEWKHYPESTSNPMRWVAAEAAECANDQGMFWEMHDRIFEVMEAKEGKVEWADFTTAAEKVGLDMRSFNKCLESGAKTATVQRDLAEAQQLGVKSTPLFFINEKPMQSSDILGELKKALGMETAPSATPAGR